MMPTPIDMPSGNLRPPPAAGGHDAMDALAALFDLGFQAANETVLGTAKTWDAVFRAYVDTCDASRQIFGGLLVDWHQRFLIPPG